jgi:hypothetical protein
MKESDKFGNNMNDVLGYAIHDVAPERGPSIALLRFIRSAIDGKSVTWRQRRQLEKK